MKLVNFFIFNFESIPGKPVGYAYFVRLLTIIAFFFLCTGVLNLLVDPYDVFRIASIEGFNKYKAVENPPLRLKRAYQAFHDKPDAIILGSSRVGVGFDENHTGWADDVNNPKNFSLSGSNIFELKSYLEHIHHVSPLKQVVIGLDFFSFNYYMNPAIDFETTRLIQESNHLPIPGFIKDVGVLLFSLDATKQSIITIISQNEKKHSKETEMMLTFGQRHRFELLERSYLTNTWFPCPTKKFSLGNLSTDENSLATFQSILEFSRSQNIDLRLFISPVHARLLVALEDAGLWDEFEQWKIELVKTLDREAQKHPAAQTFVIWDFAYFSDFNMEEVPEKNDLTSRMHWFEDSAHFSREYGKMILEQILANEQKSAQANGIKLQSKGINDWLDSISQKRSSYKNKYPEDTFSIQQLAEKIAKWNQRKNACI